MNRNKHDIITFKVDETLRELMNGIENRSEFIRSAILTALDSACPLCKGTGVLTPKQKEHWQEFSRAHAVEECDDCHELYLTCAAENQTD